MDGNLGRIGMCVGEHGIAAGSGTIQLQPVGVSLHTLIRSHERSKHFIGLRPGFSFGYGRAISGARANLNHFSSVGTSIAPVRNGSGLPGDRVVRPAQSLRKEEYHVADE